MGRMTGYGTNTVTGGAWPIGVGKFRSGGGGSRGLSSGKAGRGMKLSRGGNICGTRGSWLSMNTGGGILNMGFGGNGGGGGW